MGPKSSREASHEDEDEKLVIACSEGDATTVRALLAAGNVDIDARDEFGYTPLHNAALRSHLQIVELLLQVHANPNAADRSGETPLHYACSNGHLQVVELLLKAQSNTSTKDEVGRTPLFCASSNGHLQIVDLLLKANADIDAADKYGRTPLHDACEYHKRDVVHALLVAGADLHAKDNFGHEPMHYCIKSKTFYPLMHETLEMLQVLVSFGARWDVQSDELVAHGRTSIETPALRMCMLLWAQEHADGRAFTDIPVEIVKRGADSTQTFIDSLKTSREIVLRRKICLVGPSCAGKTSFVKSITSDQTQLVHMDDRTIGIDHFPHRFIDGRSSIRIPTVHEVTFWDFAGQDAYQVAHSLFFSPRTLFLVCVDLEAFTTAVLQASIMSNMKKQETQLMDEFIERTVMQWVRLILARQPDAELAFIVTKADLLADNTATEQLFKTSLTEKLKEVETTAQQMRDQLTRQDERRADQKLTFGSEKSVGAATSEPTIVFASCTSPASVQAAKIRIEDLIIESKRSFTMPDTYSRVLDAIVDIRQTATSNDIVGRITRVFASVDTLPAKLKLKPKLCRTILQTLHDLGDVLWYEDLDVELFQNTVILDPLLLIDFIRQVITHKHTGVTMSHADLKSKPFWNGLANENQMKAMKQVLQAFNLVYATGEARIMEWDSDLIVPAFWQTKTPASWLFLGDILRINSTKSCEGEAVRVEWEYHFEYGLPSSLFDHLVVASVSPYVKFDAGPDWIVYEEKGIAACRIMIGRDPTSLHRTIHVEAVVAEAATQKQVNKLWKCFRQLCGAFVGVLREYPGLAGVSSFAWDDDHTKINMKRLLQSPYDDDAATWMPPAATWSWFKQLTTTSV